MTFHSVTTPQRTRLCAEHEIGTENEGARFIRLVVRGLRIKPGWFVPKLWLTLCVRAFITASLQRLDQPVPTALPVPVKYRR